MYGNAPYALLHSQLVLVMASRLTTELEVSSESEDRTQIFPQVNIKDNEDNGTTKLLSVRKLSFMSKYQPVENQDVSRTYGRIHLPATQILHICPGFILIS